jgi:hypothetical protein
MRPYELPQTNNRAILTEVAVSAYLYFMLLLTDYVTTSENTHFDIRLYIAWALAGILFIVIIVNLFSVFSALHTKLRLQFSRYRSKLYKFFIKRRPRRLPVVPIKPSSINQQSTLLSIINQSNSAVFD